MGKSVHNLVGGLCVVAVAGAASPSRPDEALKTLEETLRIARSAGGERLIGQITKHITLYKQRSP